MKDVERTQYMRSSLGMAGIAVNDFMAEMVWRLNDGISSKGGDFNLRDVAKIEAMMNDKYATGKKINVPSGKSQSKDELSTKK